MKDTFGGTFGSAEWMTPDEARSLGYLDGPGLRFGTSATGPYYRYNGDGHSLIVAPPGAGKGIGFVIPNLIFYEGSMIVIDPKGENAKQTAEYRRKHLGQDVFVLDPSGVSGLPSASYNPLSWLEGASRDDFMADVVEFSQAVIESGYSKEPYWADCAQHLFRGLVFHLASGPQDKFNLKQLSDLSQLPLPRFIALMKSMQNNTCSDPLLRDWISETGAWYLSQTEDHQKFHLGTMISAIGWMDNPGAQRIMAKSDFDFRDVKRKGMTIYLCIHPLQLGAYRGWFRLLISQAVKGVFEPIGKPIVNIAGKDAERSVVFMLDEYARAVGRLAAIDNAIPQVRGYGGRFAFVLQSIGQAKDLYKEGWNAFEESCALQIFMQARGDTAEHVSKRLGVTTVPVQNSGGISQTGRPLYFPNEVSARPKDDVIAFIDGKRPVRLKRITSYLDPSVAPHLAQSNMERQAGTNNTVPLMGLVRSQQKTSATTVGDVTTASGDMTSSPQLSKAEKMQAALCAYLSAKHDDVKVYKHTDGRYGYDDEMGMFVQVR